MILDNKQVYNAAIVLNNIGVDLLERRCYKQALATLVDATNIMQAVLRRLLSSETNDKLDVEAIIQRANRCRANPTAIESNSYYRIVNIADDYSGILMEEDNGRPRNAIGHSFAQHGPCPPLSCSGDPSEWYHFEACHSAL
jgi:hypothetical protein